VKVISKTIPFGDQKIVIETGKIASIFREKNQVKLVGVGQECGITLKDFNDYQKKDIIEAFSSTSTERMI